MSPERLRVDIHLGLPGFTLDAEWTASDGVTALFGPSGAGKTLTLRCLAGLERPERGRIEVEGRVCFDSGAGIDLPPPQRRIAHVLQGDGLAPDLTVLDIVAAGLHDRPEPERARRAGEVIERLGLADLQARHPRELSDGERQRVALGRALALDPALVLLDEPLSALDRPARESLREELRPMLAGWGIPIVVATGDFTDAYRLADRIVVYRDGRVIQAAPRADLLWRSGAEAVARVMGLRNIFHGVVLKATADRIQLRWRGQTLEAVNSPSRPYLPPPGSPLSFFVRPEYVRLIRKDRAVPDDRHHMNLMRGTVVRQTDYGTTWTLAIRLDEPGPPAQGEHDLEVEVPRMVHEILELAHDRHWQFSIHRGSIQVLPA